MNVFGLVSHDPEGSCDTNGHQLPSPDEGREILPKIRELFPILLTLCVECFVRKIVIMFNDLVYSICIAVMRINIIMMINMIKLVLKILVTELIDFQDGINNITGE